MAMMQVVCNKCGFNMPMRGWVEKEDLIGTKYEYLMDTITKDELNKLEESGEIKDEFDRWESGGGICPDCGSKKTFWL